MYPASKDFLYAVQAQTQMYVVRFMAKLEKDTSYKELWTMGFMLREF